jgi:hypothetical protein
MGTRRTEHVGESELVLRCAEDHEVVWVEWDMT